MKIPHSSVSSVYFFFMLFLCFSLKAQGQSNKEDIIYHKNGSVIRGHLIENIKDTNKISIETYAKNLWVFDRSEIDSIVTRTLPTRNSNTANREKDKRSYVQERGEKKSEKRELNEKGYYNLTGISYLLGDFIYDGVGFAVRSVNGYRFNKHISAGLGTGLDLMDGGYIPLYLEGRYDVLKGFFSPYVSVQGGYSFFMPVFNSPPADNGSYGGMLFHPNIGVRKNFTHEWGMTLGFGYHIQKATTSYDDVVWNPDGSTSPVTYVNTITYKRLTINCRFIFN